MSRVVALAVVAATSVTIASTVRASQLSGPPARAPIPARAGVLTADAAFVAKATDAAAALQDLARLGTARGSDASVKVFAKRLIEEQAAIAEGLTALARAKRVENAPPPAAVREETAARARHSCRVPAVPPARWDGGRPPPDRRVPCSPPASRPLRPRLSVGFFARGPSPG